MMGQMSPALPSGLVKLIIMTVMAVPSEEQQSEVEGGWRSSKIMVTFFIKRNNSDFTVNQVFRGLNKARD